MCSRAGILENARQTKTSAVTLLPARSLLFCFSPTGRFADGDKDTQIALKTGRAEVFHALSDLAFEVAAVLSPGVKP